MAALGILLSISLIIHELGHLLAALVFHVRVSKFCLFFDPWYRLIDTGKLFRTRFCIGWIPFGAYVRFTSVDEDPVNHQNLFDNIHPLKRIAISLSGVIMNLLTAYLCVFAWVGNHTNKIQRYSIAKHVVITHRIIHNETGSIVTSIYDYWQTRDEVSNKTKDASYTTNHNRKTSVSWSRYLFMFIRLNLLLFLFNLFPLPPLDGAQALYHFYEYVFRKPLNSTFQAIAGCIGFIAIMGTNLIELIKYIFTIFE